jgi:hypothetical protein
VGASAKGEVLLGQARVRPVHKVEPAPWQPAAALLAVCLLFGGASQDNALPLALTELAAIGLLFLQVQRWRQAPPPPHARGGLIFLGVVAAIVTLQLVPLPPDLWASLPGRARLAADLKLAGAGEAWRPFSLAPETTWRSLLALLPPAAMFAATAELDDSGRRRLAGLILAFALVSVILAALQLAGGPLSPLRFYRITNADSGVGFFANRNHLADLLVVSMPLAAALAVDWGLEGRRGSMLRVAASLGVYLLLMVGVGVSLSRAGMLLLAPAVLASLAIALAARGPSRQRPAALMLVGASVVGLFIVGAFSLAAVAQRFHDVGAADIRFQAAPVIVRVAQTYAPLGAGVGAFEPVYRAAEPMALLMPNYLNHAHDDYLEVWLEAGLIGVAGIAVFAMWWARASVRAWLTVWRRTAPSLLPAGASASLCLMMLHSAVDYPLRTVAMSTVLAFCCGVICKPPAQVSE